MENKIVFTGPVGSGKTTSIRSVSDIEVVDTDVQPSDEVAQRKSGTTIAMDYGVLNLANGQRVHLYGTPGQERFNFMWEILCEGAIGLVILIDSLRPDPPSDLDDYLRAFGWFVRSGKAVVIGVTRTEAGGRTDMRARLHERLGAARLNIPLFEIDGRRREDVKQMLLALLSLLDPPNANWGSAAH